MPRLPGATLALAIALSPVLAQAQSTAPAASPASASPTPASPPRSAAECAVWEREASFARAVEQHDAAAFAEHLHPDAAFISGRDQVARGRSAVIADWAPLVAGDALRLHWYPDAVTVSGDSGVAVSRGPYWIEFLDPKAPQRYVAGRFISTWVRDDAGTWHVLYDGGGGGQATPASGADIARLQAKRAACRPD